MCVWVSTHVTEHTWRSESSFVELVLSLHLMWILEIIFRSSGSRDKRFPNEPSHQLS